jgi:hypothetical protein
MTESSMVKNLGAVFDAHVKAEFIDKDVAATMATMVAEPYLTHVDRGHRLHRRCTFPTILFPLLRLP